ncbi:hypothetical protein FSP39_004994 [Pinctada imbricata]|uniref:Zinc finger protein 865 n=1 Tax=Pinctada imbricata TaxID=66713 RepID=A0AA88Y6Q0_PINIB|nr:hypothetical protein FSP39_004994 [Pinctada imbricata]
MEVDASPQVTPDLTPSEKTNGLVGTHSSTNMLHVPVKEEVLQDSSYNIPPGNTYAFDGTPSMFNMPNQPEELPLDFSLSHKNIQSRGNFYSDDVISLCKSSYLKEDVPKGSQDNIPSEEYDSSQFVPNTQELQDSRSNDTPSKEWDGSHGTLAVSNTLRIPEEVPRGSPDSNLTEETNGFDGTLSMSSTIHQTKEVEHQSIGNLSELDIERSNVSSVDETEEARKHKCNLCDRRYKLKRDLVRHMKVHSEDNPFVCNICGLVYMYKSVLIQHIAKHSAEKKHKCTLCEERFFNDGDLQTHVQKKHPEVRPFQCDICKKYFKTKQNLKKHIKAHFEEKKYHCDVCGKKFRTTTNLKFHLRVHFKEVLRSNPLPPGEERNECEKILQDSLGLPLFPEKRFKCDMCGNAFTSRFNLKSHKMTHSGDFPYQCEICGKKFGHNSFLKRHLRIHTGDKPYKCNLCDRAYNCSNDLKSHSVVHTGEQPFKCDICQKTFSFKSSLKAHLKIHSGERNYKCDICSREFMCSYSMVLHKRTHSGERSYKCDTCDKAFFNTSNLNHHRRRVHGKKARSAKNNEERETSLPVDI